jgi:hypothetical protein
MGGPPPDLRTSPTVVRLALPTLGPNAWTQAAMAAVELFVGCGDELPCADAGDEPWLAVVCEPPVVDAAMAAAPTTTALAILIRRTPDWTRRTHRSVAPCYQLSHWLWGCSMYTRPVGEVQVHMPSGDSSRCQPPWVFIR